MAQDYLSHYQFNPFQFAVNDRASIHLHRKMARYFDKCNNVIDLGCGRGDFLQALRRMGIKGFGIDAFEESIEICRTKGICSEKCDVFDYVTRRESGLADFDGVYCAHLIEHLSPERVFELFTRLYGSTKSGTKFVFVTPNFDDVEISGSVFWMDLTHVRPYPGLLVQRMLENVGFRKAHYRSIYGLGLNRSMLLNYVLQKIRFGNKIYKPNLVITALR